MGIDDNPHSIKAGGMRGLGKPPESDGSEEPSLKGAIIAASDANAWFVREVLPLEAVLTNFLRRSLRNKSEVADVRQEVYVRVYEAACKEIRDPARPFVLTVARNLLINRVHREQVVSIEAIADLDALNIASDEPGADRNTMARQELRRLKYALDCLPQRARDVIVMRKIEGLSRREIAARLGIGEATVAEHLTRGVCALTKLLYRDLDPGADNE